MHWFDFSKTECQLEVDSVTQNSNSGNIRQQKFHATKECLDFTALMINSSTTYVPTNMVQALPRPPKNSNMESFAIIRHGF